MQSSVGRAVRPVCPGWPSRGLRSATLASALVVLAVHLTSMGSAVAADVAVEQGCRARDFENQGGQRQSVAWPKELPAAPADQACWIRADALSGQISERSGVAADTLTLVDVRPLSLRRSSPLSSALQMDLSDVQDKRFLQQSRVVLVGSGLDYARLQQTCQTLRQGGFADVRTLQGGAPAWARAQSAPGRASASSSGQGLGTQTFMQVQQIEASEWIASLREGMQWSVLSLSSGFDASSSAERPVDAGRVIRPGVLAGSRSGFVEGALAKALQEAASRAGSEHPRRIEPAQALIVIVDGGESAQLLADFERALGRRADWPADWPVYWLRGGWPGYRDQVAQAQAIQQTAAFQLQPPCGRL